jgi:hypothetical protein
LGWVTSIKLEDEPRKYTEVLKRIVKRRDNFIGFIGDKFTVEI